MVSYLTLGYGSYWSFPGGGGNSSEQANQQPAADGKSNLEPHLQSPKLPTSLESSGHYLIGLKGDIEDDTAVVNDVEGTLGSDDAEDDDENNSRTVLRTLHVELEGSSAENRAEGTVIRDFEHEVNPLTRSQAVGGLLAGFDSHDINMAEKLRVVVYVNKPFIFTFLFRLRTESLALDTLYRSLHYQLAPLRKPLLASTRYRPERPDAGPVSSHIQDLVWDPPSLTVHSSIPNIPDFFPDSSSSSPSSSSSWSRADAVSTHLHLLNIYVATRYHIADLERTQKTNRGWWIVWTRVLQRTAATTPSTTTTATALPLSTIHESASSSSLTSHEPSTQDQDKAPSSRRSSTSASSSHSPPPAVDKEIFLIRRASDHIGFRRAADDGASGGGEGLGRLAQGIGVDTRRYVEELLTLL